MDEHLCPVSNNPVKGCVNLAEGLQRPLLDTGLRGLCVDEFPDSSARLLNSRGARIAGVNGKSEPKERLRVPTLAASQIQNGARHRNRRKHSEQGIRWGIRRRRGNHDRLIGSG